MTIEEIKKVVIPIAKNYEIPKIALFGSVSKGINNESSDIDFLIEKGAKIRDLWDLSDFVKTLEQTLNRNVDVITYSGVKNSLLAKSILDSEIVIYEA